MSARPIERRDDPLQGYRSKRDFALTPEPRGEAPHGMENWAFVVQKHWATGLHYDIRLELGGVLKSWAVPKGPSLDPKVRRMAVAVEDHPLAYGAFEGVIPAHQYGAGKVILWDTGIWTPLHDPGPALQEGHLKFKLQGHKLQGRWVLVRTKGRGESQTVWLLIKEKDAYARATRDYNVVDALPWSVKMPGAPSAGTRQAGARARAAKASSLPIDAVPAALPPALAPQLPTLADGPPPDAAAWLYEIKFDGYRLLVRNDAAGVSLFTRNGHDWTSRLSSLRAAFEALKLPAGWYDGEIVVPDRIGVPDFGALQQAFEAGHTDDVVLYLFDLPFVDGHDLRSAPLDARRAVLKRLLSASAPGRIRFSEEFDAAPHSVLASACSMGLEGIIAKRRSAAYRSSRSADWIKLKCSQRQEFVIGGYTGPQGTRSGFGALMLGVHDAQGTLQYAGNVGTGFSAQALNDITKALRARSELRSPFPAAVKAEGRSHWVRPTLVAEVAFREWTAKGRVRHAVFRGLRADKEASAIVRETPLRLTGAPEAPAPRTEVPHALPLGTRVTHPQRVIDTRSGATKLDLVRHYGQVGALMVWHLKGRPVALVRAPAGVGGELFFQKHARAGTLAGVRQISSSSLGDGEGLLEVSGSRGLVAAAQGNVIEFHTHNARTGMLDHPDRMVFDLDPGEGVPWTHVQEAAQLLKGFLTHLGLAAFLKTSGGKGLHVVVPVRRVHDWATVKGFSQAVVLHIAGTIPHRFVARSGPRNRVGKIFIDYLRNGPGATTVCAWSVRARPGLGVSVPVAWEELSALRGGDHWSVRRIDERLEVGNAPWKGYARAARGLAPAMAALGYAPASP